MSGSKPMLPPAWWCSPHPTRFPAPVQHKDARNRTGLIPLPTYHKGYGHRVRDPQHSPKNGLSPAQHIPEGAARGEIIPVKKLRGMRDPVPTKPVLASDRGRSGQDAGCLTPIPRPRVSPPVTTPACSP